MQKKLYAGILRTVLFLALLSMSILGVQEILRNKRCTVNKYEFFNSETPFDILFLGSSHMHEGIDPIYVWEKYGITSYNLAGAGESIQITYFLLKEALEHCTPKLVVVDSYKIGTDKHALNQGYGFVHSSIGTLPLNRNKLEAIFYIGERLKEGPLPFLFPLYAFHDRYAELEKDDFLLTPNLDKGAYILTGIYPVEPPKEFFEGTGKVGDGDGEEAFKQILRLCKEKNVPCLFTNIPMNGSGYTAGFQRHTRAIFEYAKDNGADAFDFTEDFDAIGLDYAHDFGDPSHLNFMGAEKVADYLIPRLAEKYALGDRRGDPDYASWERDLERWREQKIENLEGMNEPVSYIFGTVDTGSRVEIMAKSPDQRISSHYGLDYCLDYMGIEPETATSEDIGSFDMRIVVRDEESGKWRAEKHFIYDKLSGRYAEE